MNEKEKLSEMLREWIKDQYILVGDSYAIVQLLKSIESLEAQLKESDEKQVPRLYLVGELIANDWSGSEFDGRDVQDWIDLILGGLYDEFDEEVKQFAKDSVLYDKIMAQKEADKSPSPTPFRRE